ncbi:MAG TPA: glycosyltransferase family 1 protein [Anaerolineae bacterium]
MIVGIDASRAVSVAPTGTETYSRELIRALLALDRANTYRLYTRESVSREFFASAPNIEIRSIPFPRFWTHMRLSVEMLTRPPDLLFVPAHVLPLVHPQRSIVTVHDLGQLHFPEAYPVRDRQYHDFSARWNVRVASHIFADSEATRDDLLEYYGTESAKITTIYPAYDEKLYRPNAEPLKTEQLRARFRIGNDYILAIGTIHPRKNYARLIEAFGRLTNRDLQLIIVGKRGWLYESILARSQGPDVVGRVQFLDYIPTIEMPALIRGARLLAFPSLHEGFGLPILEAQACGTPVVCSMTSSMPEVAGDAALFVDPLDVDAIAGAVERLLSDGALRAKLIGHGFQNVKRFSWAQSAHKVLDILSKT